MIPNSDEHPVRVWPFVTWALIMFCIATYLWQTQHIGDAWGDLMLRYGFTPSKLMSPQIDTEGAPAVVSIFTAMFLHGSWQHLLGNMLFLWVFGNNLEEGMGHLRFLLLYVLSGIASALTMAFLDPLSPQPMLGASGAITGVIGACMLLYPRAPIVFAIPVLLVVYKLHIKPIWLLGMWFLMQLLALTGPDTSEIAWWAHLGGLAAGLLLTPILKSPDQPFFGPKNSRGPTATG